MENHCLYCDEQLHFQFDWHSLWKKSKLLLCPTCLSQLEPVEGEICRCCGRTFCKGSDRFWVDEHCYDCIRWENDPQWQGLLIKNRSLFRYNDFLKGLIARYKYRGDTVLATIFHESLSQLYKREFPQHALIVPIPLSKERLMERGFNQAERFASMLGEPLPVLLAKNNKDKQSKKSRSKRISPTISPFYLDSRLQEKLISADIIIVDDIYTTGTTIRHAAKLFRQHGARTVSSITIAR